jgi:hypothetical protein
LERLYNYLNISSHYTSFSSNLDFKSTISYFCSLTYNSSQLIYLSFSSINNLAISDICEFCEIVLVNLSQSVKILVLKVFAWENCALSIFSSESSQAYYLSSISLCLLNISVVRGNYKLNCYDDVFAFTLCT